MKNQLLRMPPRCLTQQECVGSNSTGTAMSLALLFACRQIYSEAALVPFATNDFVFTSSYDLHEFVRRLTALQAKSLHAIVMTHSFNDAWYETVSLHYRRNAFRHLRSVVIISGSGTSRCCNHPCSFLEHCSFKARRRNNHDRRRILIIMAGDVQGQQDDGDKEETPLQCRPLGCPCAALFPYDVMSLTYEAGHEEQAHCTQKTCAP